MRLPEPKPQYDQRYFNELIKALRNKISDLETQLGITTSGTSLQSQIDAINEILARHHIT